MKDFCLYTNRMMICEEQFCVNCEVYRRWLLKTDKLLRGIGCEEIKEKCV